MTLCEEADVPVQGSQAYVDLTLVLIVEPQSNF